MTIESLKSQISEELAGLDLNSRIDAINQLREVIAEHSPFATQPVDFVRWVKSDRVHANDYNPNVVAPPEMELLRVSIQHDGYTQPIVTMADDSGDGIEVIDGFHRHRVGKECADVQELVHGYLPVVQIRTSQADRNDRIASTIRHNRARGTHLLDPKKAIVKKLMDEGKTVDEIGKQLGMKPEEIFRLSGFTKDEFLNMMTKDHPTYSKAKVIRSI